MIQTLSEAMEFDVAVRIAVDGTFEQDLDITVPEHVYQDVDEDGQCVDDVLHGLEGEWEALTGFTGQYSYNGPVMHSSEYIGGKLEREILGTPGVYVSVPVLAEGPNEDEESDFIGWAVLRKNTTLDDVAP